MADIGAQTPFFYIFRERELIYDLFEAATAMRMMHNYFRIGGIAADLPHGWIDKCLDFCDYFLTGVAEYQKLITRNPIFLERVEGVGIIGGEEALNWGLSGGRKKEREGWGFSRFWHSGPPVGGSHDGLLAQW
ncbi:NAD(P)H-quinone oxidoreductase subunit H [Abeliophyllum distichum]|uniref:NAD(P)H-quinone oxidoreductase subunit H n=1 Tax=Abeliophyllum distichum TaxID=126358 RepID=A0ABD1VZM8_9LAMI